MSRPDRRQWISYYLRVAVVVVPVSLILGLVMGVVIAYWHVVGIVLVGALLLAAGKAWPWLQRNVYGVLDARFLHRPAAPPPAP